MSFAKKNLLLSLGALGTLALLILGALKHSLDKNQVECLAIQKADLMSITQQKLHEQTQMGLEILDHFSELANKDTLELEVYQQQAINAINAMRWDNGGYFFIFDKQANVISIPSRPDLTGKNMSTAKDANGVPYIDKLVRGANEGDNFVEYMFNKPNLEGVFPKLSISTSFKDWNWVVGTGVYIDDIDEKVAAISKTLEKQTHAILWKVIGLTLGMLVVVTIVLSQILKLSLLPLVKIDQSLSVISTGEGDLTVSLEAKGNNEIGRIGKSFNAFVKKIHQIISEVKANTLSLASQSEQLSSTSQNLEQGSLSLRSRTTDVRQASEQTKERLNSIAAGSEEFSATVNQVAATVEELTISFGTVVNSCQKEMSISSTANAKVNETVIAIREMEKASQEIGKVSKLIQDVAVQTNLLALNATIEAASAGEAGKGFAVVAEEVKALAQQTAAAVGTIGNQVSEVQAKAKESSEFITSIKELITEVSAMAQTILDTVQEQSFAVNEFSKNLAEAGTTAKDIAKEVAGASASHLVIHKNLAEIDELTESSANGVSQIRESMTDLARMASQLENLVGSFRT